MKDNRSEQISVRFTKDELSRIDKLAEREMLSRAAYVRRNIMKGVLTDEESRDL